MKLSKKLKLIIAAAALGFGGVSLAQAATIDVVQAPTGYFVPTDAQKYDWPYYRFYTNSVAGDGDWGWSHGAIGGTITSAYLMISAYDVDAPSEVDEIWVDNNGTPTYLGDLTGANNIWNFTWFTLSSDLYDDITTGLDVSIKIDTGTQFDWAVALAKSQLCINADPDNYRTECAANPNPNSVPEPASLALLGLGLASLAAVRRRKASI